MAARIVLALVAVLVLAWLGVLLRNEHILHSVGDRVFSTAGRDRQGLTRDLRRLEGAGLLTPDPQADLHRAGVLMLARRPQDAAAIAGAQARREPENLDAWTVLYRATRKTDPRRASVALRQIRRLNPLSAPAAADGTAQP